MPPSQTSEDYSTNLADIATHILYRSPLPSQNDLPIFILNAAAFPDTKDIDFDVLLPYVLARFPDEDELIDGKGYEVVFFAGGSDGATSAVKKGRPGWGWFLQAYHVLSRAMRKRLQRLYVVHERNWVRIMIETFSSIVSPKFRKKIVHVSTLSALALYIPIEDLLIPPSTYHYDRGLSSDIHVPYVSGKRAFGVKEPLPTSSTGHVRLPRVLREATSFVLLEENIKTEGIFRINPRTLTVDVLKEAYDRGQKFIVWRDGDSVLTFSHWKEGYGNVMVDEIEQMEGYPLFVAAGLIKQWYSQLREPIFAPSCYAQIERLFGDTNSEIQISQLVELLSVPSEWSLVSQPSRLILTLHLLPLMSKISEYQDWNQMSPYNLAVCFAPSLLRGPDPLRDAKVAGIIRRVLEAAVHHWKTDLAGSCGIDGWDFAEALRVPEAVDEREDKLEEAGTEPNTLDAQSEGIVLIDNDGSDDEGQDRPALPPRPVAAYSDSIQVRRKPAPTLQNPPRYSTIFADSPVDVLQAPGYEAVDEDQSTRTPQ